MEKKFYQFPLIDSYPSILTQQFPTFINSPLPNSHPPDEIPIKHQNLPCKFMYLNKNKN